MTPQEQRVIEAARLRDFADAHKRGQALRICWDTDERLVERGYLTEIAPSFYKPTQQALEALDKGEENTQ